MTFAPFMLAARIAIAAATVAALGLGAPSPTWAGGNLARIFVGQDETILFPVPECPECVAVFLGRSPEEGVFAAERMRPD